MPRERMDGSSAPRSLQVIAKLLDAEGFSDFTANQVERYWRENVENLRAKGRNDRTERAFAETITPMLTDTQRLVLGKWIAFRLEQAFQTGLRLGLMTAVTRNLELNESIERRAKEGT